MSRLPRNLLTVYLANGLNGVIGAIAVPVTVKLLGLEDYGLLSIYSLLVSFVLLADFGVSKNLLRILSENPDTETQRSNIRVALGLYVLLCAVWVAVFPLLAVIVPKYLFPVSQEYVAGLRWMVVLSIAEFILGVPASLMQTACVAGQRFEAYSAFTFTTGLTRNAAILAGAAVFHSPVAVAAVLAGRKLVDLAIASRLLGRFPAGAWMPIFDARRFRAMMSQSLTLSAAQVMYATLMSLGSALVNAAFGLHGLGLYRSAFDLAGKIAFVSNGVTLVVFPRAARYFASSQRAEHEGALLEAVTRCSAAAYACFAALAVWAAPYVLPAIGFEDRSTVRLFILLVIALSLNAHSLLSNELIQAAGRYRYNILLSASALGGLALLFVAGKPVAGVMAIGWAWIGTALLFALMADGLLLGICSGGKLRQITAVLVKLAATAACVGLAAREWGAGAPLATAACVAVLAALLWSGVRGVLLLRHDTVWA